MGQDGDLVLKLNQAAIDGIRSVGASSQYIFAEGNAWTGAWTWVDQNDGMKALSDPADKIIFDMHQYFDANGGSSQTCVNSTIGQERVTSATQWLRTNGKLGIIGEFSGYNDTTCKAAVAGMIEFLNQNSDVWTGACGGRLAHGGETLNIPMNPQADKHTLSTSQFCSNISPAQVSLDAVTTRKQFVGSFRRSRSQLYLIHLSASTGPSSSKLDGRGLVSQQGKRQAFLFR